MADAPREGGPLGGGDHDRGERGDHAPGDGHDGGGSIAKAVRGYLIGLVLAVALTAASFYAPVSGLIWGPAIPMALVALAIGQMGIHLVFFLHISTGPDNTNNVMALAFGVLIVALLVGGSLWIMGHLNHNMMPMDMILSQQR